jgi:hypothetical protein
MNEFANILRRLVPEVHSDGDGASAEDDFLEEGVFRNLSKTASLPSAT